MFWNKIKGKNESIILDSNPYYLRIEKEAKLDIIVNENIAAKLVIISNSDCDINIKLSKGSKLVVNSLNKDNNTNIDINLDEKSSITYNHSSLAQDSSINNFNINHLANDSISNINNNGVNINNGKLYFTINGIVPKKLNNIICNQKSKIINYDMGDAKIIPNLIIDSNDILASHSAYIGKIDDDVMFYMQARGIKKKDIERIIYKAILLGVMDLALEKEEFDKILNEWW